MAFIGLEHKSDADQELEVTAVEFMVTHQIGRVRQKWLTHNSLFCLNYTILGPFLLATPEQI